MASLPSLPTAERGAEKLSLLRWLGPFVLVAALLQLAPRLAADPRSAPPALGGALVPRNPIEQPDETFPGAAYFFAQDAFGPQPLPSAGAAGANPHVLAIDVGPPALTYRFAGRTAMDRMRALSCLTNAVYYEAANEPEEGQRAVAQVVLNRLRHPSWPNSVCGVVYEGTERDDLGCQFTFSCNGAMARPPVPGLWLRARRVAQAALGGTVFAPAGLATYYHTLAVRPPWAARMRPAAIIGAHIFYRTPGPAGDPARFADRYDGIETMAPGLHAYAAPRALDFAPIALPGAPALPEPVASAPAPAPVPDSLPQSTIRPEYRDTGRPLH